jgi:hypothetical protein
MTGVTHFHGSAFEDQLVRPLVERLQQFRQPHHHLLC